MYTMAAQTGKMEELPNWIAYFSRNVSFILDGFFCISGYLISGPLIRELSATGRIDLKSFFIRRTLRIFPPYYFLLFFQIGLGFLLLRLAKNPKENEIIFSGLKSSIYDITYLSNYYKGIIPHGWSLSLEEQFYIILPFFLLYIFRYLNRERRFILLVLLYFIPLIVRIYIHNKYLIHLPVEEAIIYYENNIYKPFHTHFDSLVAGIFLAFFIDSYKDKWLYIINSYILSRFLYILAWIILLIYNCTYSEIKVGYLEQIFRYNINNTCFFIIILFSFDKDFLINKFFSWRWFSPIAKLSYLAYLVHMLLLGILMYPLSNKKIIRIEDILINLIPFSIIIFFISYLLYLIIEKPFAILKENLTKNYKKEILPGL